MPATYPHNRYPTARPTARAFVGQRGSAWGSIRQLVNGGRPDQLLANQLYREKVETDPCLPRPVDGAEWQSGVTAGCDRYRITRNGEPVPGAVAASESAGWVDVVAMPRTSDKKEYDGVDQDDIAFGVGVRRRRLTGTIKIVPDCGA